MSWMGGRKVFFDNVIRKRGMWWSAAVEECEGGASWEEKCNSNTTMKNKK